MPEDSDGVVFNFIFNEDRDPIRVIITEMPDMENPRTQVRVTWFTQAREENSLDEWNFNCLIRGVGIPLDKVKHDMRECVLPQWRIQAPVGCSTELVPWPEEIKTLTEEHSQVHFFKEVADVKIHLASMSEMRDWRKWQ